MDSTLTISVEAMGKQLGICKKRAYELANSDGFYPAVRITERRIVIFVEALYKWLREQTKTV